MQDANNQPLLRGKSKSLKKHKEFILDKKHVEFILFGDNILECFSLLNPAIDQKEIWSFEYVVYEPVDQPIYVFKTLKNVIVSIKACGVYPNWPLPQPVIDLIYRYDLPDFVLFNVSKNKVVFAGELTETASVGNSQWQRELRKIAAAELGIPFVYQTVYSGKDDSQDTIREPTSLLVYNAFLYSIRYKTPSLVFFIEPNIETSLSRIRKDSLSPDTLSKLFCAYVINEIEEGSELHSEIERNIYQSMTNFLKEPQHSSRNSPTAKARLEIDLPCISYEVLDALLNKNSEFIEELSSFFKQSDKEAEKFFIKYDLGSFQSDKMYPWTDKKNTRFISDLFRYIENNQLTAGIAPRAKFAAGIFDTTVIINFLTQNSFKNASSELANLKKYKETVVIPIYLHKTSNGVLQFTKDPYAGNTAAFSELFAYDTNGKKSRAVVAYCVSLNPQGFNIHSKKETNIYKSIARYSDALIIDSKEIITKFEPHTKQHESYEITEIADVKPLSITEDVAVVSTFLQMGVIKSNWDACLIAIHHSSWQQIRVRNCNEVIDTAKIGRNESKVDLVMQSKENLFFAAEGKKAYTDFFSSTTERAKIEVAFNNIRKLIDDLYGGPNPEKLVAFLCLLDIPEVDSDFFLKAEKRKIKDSIAAGHLNKLANQEFLVIGVYTINFVTHFETFYSPNFDVKMKDLFNEIFNS